MDTLSDMAKIIQGKINKVSALRTDTKFLTKVGDKLENNIRNRTRSGFGNNVAGGNQSLLAPLSKKYILQRQKIRLSPHTSAGKSNLTLTGSMLDSLNSKVVTGKVELSFSGSGGRVISNGALANIHEKGLGRVPKRSFINPTFGEWREIIDQLITESIKVIKQS